MGTYKGSQAEQSKPGAEVGCNQRLSRPMGTNGNKLPKHLRLIKGLPWPPLFWALAFGLLTQVALQESPFLVKGILSLAQAQVTPFQALAWVVLSKARVQDLICLVKAQVILSLALVLAILSFLDSKFFLKALVIHS